MSPAFGKKSRMTVGWPDITFAYYGIACCWEVKFENAQLKPDQKEMRRQLLDAPNNWRHEVVRSVEQAKAILDALKEEGLRNNPCPPVLPGVTKAPCPTN